jgi:zinc transporter ZupT
MNEQYASFMSLANNQIGLLLSILAASATMIGWVIVLVKRSLSDFVVAVSLLIAAGGMIAVSLLELLPTAKEVGLTFENILM